MLRKISLSLEALRRDLLWQFRQAEQARADVMEIRSRTLETIVQSRELMVLIDRQFARGVSKLRPEVQIPTNTITALAASQSLIAQA
jgi:hypothetical protein